MLVFGKPGPRVEDFWFKICDIRASADDADDDDDDDDESEERLINIVIKSSASV